MEMKNEQRLPIPREQVWQALNNPEVLRVCIPGCESLEQVDDNTYDATVNAKVGPVKARFSGRVTLEDLQPPESYTMSFEGKGGQAGFAKGSAGVSLHEDDGGCRVSYTVSATVGGKLAQLGNRLVKGAAEKNANDFFSNFARHMGADAEPGEAQAAAAETAVPSSVRRWLWVAGAVVLVVVIFIVMM